MREHVKVKARQDKARRGSVHFAKAGQVYLVLDSLGFPCKSEGADGLWAVGHGWGNVGNHDCLGVATQGVLQL